MGVWVSVRMIQKLIVQASIVIHTMYPKWPFKFHFHLGLIWYLDVNLPLQGKRLVFVTNNSTKSRAGYLKKFTGLGLNVSAVSLSALYLIQGNPCSVHILFICWQANRCDLYCTYKRAIMISHTLIVASHPSLAFVGIFKTLPLLGLSCAFNAIGSKKNIRNRIKSSSPDCDNSVQGIIRNLLLFLFILCYGSHLSLTCTMAFEENMGLSFCAEVGVAC